MAELDPTPSRRLDEIAVSAALRRLARRGEAPWLHGEVARRMAERLALIRLQPQRIADWWSFLGASEALLRAAYPQADIVAVEPTPELAAWRREAGRAPWWSPRRLLSASPVVQLERDELSAPVQLVWANMMLHAVKDPPALLARWQRALSADGFVMFSCLGPDTLRELRELYARCGWPPPAADFVDMHDLGDMLVRAGFADPVMDQETLRLSWSTPQAALAELRTLGANASPSRPAGLRTPRWKASLERALQSLAGTDGRLSLGFEVAYGHAFRALPRAQAGEPTTVSLDEMRTLVRSGRRK
ncbi:methyltransferase domain-containing protein [Piscinibacter sp. XHJ-5]|uniref:class I SAM-dependent methyltransferase n=1 Tax=Piscinibacter sp. XHJ-5 TaxID=3037797 RepID=UPI002452C2A4|nr:methyltransferase domain-containing protein [Piscinibacter sp. XHJ-5]